MSRRGLRRIAVTLGRNTPCSTRSRNAKETTSGVSFTLIRLPSIASAILLFGSPGNIRELQNVIERSVILSSGDAFSVDELWLSKETSRPASRAATSVAFKGEAKAAQRAGDYQGRAGREQRSGFWTIRSRGQAWDVASTLEDRIKALNIDKRRFKYG